MKFMLAALCVCVLVATVCGQGSDLMRTMMLMRMMGGDSGSSSTGTAGSTAGASAGSTGGLSSLMGGGGMGMGMNPMLLMSMGGDRMREMMMCNMLQGMMRTMCLSRAFA